MTPALDLSPAPRPAPAGRRVWRQGLLETSLMLRNGEQLLLALVIPVAILVGGFTFGGRFGLDPDALVGSVLALAVWSTAFTSTAIMVGFDRRQGVLERLAATPLARSGLIGGKIVAVGLVVGLQWVVLGSVALAVGWRPHPAPLPTLAALVGAVVAAACFTALALALAGTLRAEATLGLANLVYLVGLGAGIVVPATALGPIAGPLVRLLPTGALGELLRSWAAGSTRPGHAASLVVLTAWALAALILARKVFRWTA